MKEKLGYCLISSADPGPAGTVVKQNLCLVITFSNHCLIVKTANTALLDTESIRGEAV